VVAPSATSDRIDQCRAVTTASDNSVAMAGFFYTSNSDVRVFVYKYSSAGSQVFSQTIAATGNNPREAATGVAMDSSFNVWVSGYTSAGNIPTEGSNTPTVSSSNYEIIIAKYHGTTGTLLWLRQFGTSSNEGFSSLVWDAVLSRMWILGETFGTFSGQTLTGGRDLFLLAYDTSGNVVSGTTTQFGSTADDFKKSVDLRPGGTIAVLGTVGGSIDGMTSAGGVDILLSNIQFPSSRSSLLIGSTGSDDGGSLRRGSNSTLPYMYLGAKALGSISTLNLTTIGSGDVLVMKLHPCSTWSCDGMCCTSYLVLR